MRRMTASQITDLHAARSRKGAGYAPSLAECIDAAREGRLFDVDTRSDGEDGLEVVAPCAPGDHADLVLGAWALATRGDDVEASGCGEVRWALDRGWTAERVTLAA